MGHYAGKDNYHTKTLDNRFEQIDVGLAAGSGDERPYWVEFEVLKLAGVAVE